MMTAVINHSFVLCFGSTIARGWSRWGEFQGQFSEAQEGVLAGVLQQKGAETAVQTQVTLVMDGGWHAVTETLVAGTDGDESPPRVRVVDDGTGALEKRSKLSLLFGRAWVSESKFGCPSRAWPHVKIQLEPALELNN